MRIFGDRSESSGEAIVPEDERAEPEFPPARQSLHAIRTLVDTEKLRGTMRIVRGGRDYAMVWRITASLHSSIDYELEVEGISLDEVAFTALDALQQMLP